MDESLLEVLRCAFCGTRFTVVENAALARDGAGIHSGVLGCECCAYPIVAGIPVLIADDATRDAMHALEAGRREAALLMLLGLEGTRADRFRALLARGAPGATYREALDILSIDAEGTCFVYRFSDPTFVMAEALLQAVGQAQWPLTGRALDLCGGSGHFSRVLAALEPAGGTLVADVFFWKLWLAASFTAPGCAPICCDANAPLPLAAESCSLVLLADAYPYIWHKRLLADEMMRLAGPAGVVVLPHLHSALGDNFSAGDPLTPSAYHELFARHQPRLFSDRRLLDDVLARRVIDLTGHVAPQALGDEASLTLVASRRAELFGRYEVPNSQAVRGALVINPLYHIERRGAMSVLTLQFPTPEYAAEFGACRRYLPEQVIIEADLTPPLEPGRFGSAYAELRRRRVLLDAPPRYC